MAKNMAALMLEASCQELQGRSDLDLLRGPAWALISNYSNYMNLADAIRYQGLCTIGLEKGLLTSPVVRHLHHAPFGS